MILQSQDEWDYDDSNKTDFPILTTDTVASQQDYGLPTGTLKIKRLEVSYDGTTWKVASPLDINQYGKGTDTTAIATNFTVDSPYYDVLGSSLMLYPIPSSAITKGLKIWIDRTATEFTSGDVTTGTKLPGFDVNFHDLLPLGVAYDWLVAKQPEKAGNIWAEIQDMEARLKNHYSTKQKARAYNFNPNLEDYS